MKPNTLTTSLNNKTVLIADHVPERLSRLGKQLRSEGFTILVATEGKQALAILRSKQPHFLIAAAALPEIDGFALCSRVKTEELVPGIKIFIASPTASLQDMERANATNTDEFVTGASADEMINKIMNLLKPERPNLLQHEPPLTAQPQKVLLVEDNELNQNYISAILQVAGFIVDVVESGAQALSRLAEVNYALVLTDISLPGMDGIELARHIRSHCSVHLPIIAISGHSADDYVDACKTAGITAFVMKPFTAGKLMHAVNQTLQPHVAESRPAPVLQHHIQASGLKTYNYSHAVEVAHGDEELLKKWLMHFKKGLDGALVAVNTAIDSNCYPERQQSFHEMLNYSGYFGLDDLRVYIRELYAIRHQPDNAEKMQSYYRKIKNELESISSYYTERN